MEGAGAGTKSGERLGGRPIVMSGSAGRGGRKCSGVSPSRLSVDLRLSDINTHRAEASKSGSHVGSSICVRIAPRPVPLGSWLAVMLAT